MLNSAYIFSSCSPLPFNRAADTVKKHAILNMFYTGKMLFPNFFPTIFSAIQSVRSASPDHFCLNKIGNTFLTVKSSRMGGVPGHTFS
jgi:uncharacterized membrane protein